MQDSYLTLPTRPDFGNPHPECRPRKLEVKITFSRKSCQSSSSGYLHILEYARHKYDTDDMARHRPTSETQNHIRFGGRYFGLWVKAGTARLLCLHRFVGCNHLITFLRPGISWSSVAATPAGAETGVYCESGSPGRAGFYP